METGNNSKNLEQVPATRISAHSDGPHPGRPPLPNHSKVAAKEYEPRGWGMPPAIPSPNSRRLKISTGVGSNLNPAKTREKKQSVMRMPSATRRQSSIVVLTHGHGEPRKPMTKWKRGYVGFKREVRSYRLGVELAHCMITITRFTMFSVEIMYKYYRNSYVPIQV